MRLPEPIETTGIFWLPERPDAHLPGILKISESGKVTVELTGTFGNPLVAPDRLGFAATPSMEGETGDPDRVVGAVRQGGRVTLDGCFWQKTGLSFPSGVSTSTIYSAIAFVGAEYEGEEDPLFSEFSFSIEGLDSWLWFPVLDIERSPNRREGVIRYELPDDITLALPSNVELSFRFGLHSPNVSLPITEIKVQQTVDVLVKTEDPQPVDYFSSLAFKLCNFLTLALDQAVSIQSMTGYVDQENAGGQNHRRPVKVYAQFPPRPEREPTVHWHRALFRYPDVAGLFDVMIAKWFEDYETFEPAFNLYFAVRAEPSQFMETKILWLAQSLETLHRRSSDETEMAEEEFTLLKESILQSCPQDRREWLNTRLQYANELSLRNRLRALIEPFERWFGDRSTSRPFVNMACDTRNYLTHYDEATTVDRATTLDEKFGLYKKLEALFQLHLLSLIGIDESTIDSIVLGNQGLHRVLGVRDN